MIFEALVVYSIVLTGVLFLIFIKTPALIFLKSGVVLGREGADRSFELKLGKRRGNLIETDDGYYIVEPSHVLIEPRSKKPIVLVYSRYATPLSLEQAQVAEELKNMGVSNFEELVKQIIELKKQGINEIKIGGKSVELSKVIDYFNNTERADYIKGEIENRVASIVVKRFGFGGIDFIKIGIFAFLIVVGIAIAYFILGGHLGQTVASTVGSVISHPETNITVPVEIK